MESNENIKLFFIAFVCEHKYTIIFKIQKMIIYLCRNY